MQCYKEWVSSERYEPANARFIKYRKELQGSSNECQISQGTFEAVWIFDITRYAE